MLKHAKKMIAFTLMGCILAGTVLTGCSSSKSSTSEGETPTVTVLVNKHPLTQKMSKMKWVSQIEKMAGVKIKWQEVSADFDKKKTPMLASGDIPDIIIGGINDADFATYGSLFEDLGKDLDSLPNVKKMFKENPNTKLLSTQANGKIYSLPAYNKYWPTTSTRQYINKTWLDKLGLKVPTTWDELFDVLKAFKEKDPNGNGKADEIPFTWSPVGSGGFGYFQPSVLLGSLGITIADGGGQGYFVEDGKVKNFLYDERYKEVVEFLHKCFAAGLIDKSVFTEDYSTNQSKARGTGKTAAVGFSYGWTASDRFGSDIADQYVPVDILKAKPDQTNKLSWTYDLSLNYLGDEIQMSAKTKNKKEVLKLVNAFYDKDISVQTLWGDIGTNITKNSDGSYEVKDPPAGKDSSTWKWTSTLADGAPKYLGKDVNVKKLPADIQEAVDGSKSADEAFKNIDINKNLFPWIYIKFSQEDNTTLASNNTTMLNIAMPKFAQWIQKGNIDAEWDDYVKKMEKSGVLKNIEILQKYYDKYEAKKK